MSDEGYPVGLDCVWIASDREGHVGAFFTGGVGPIPRHALCSKVPLFDELEDHLRSLPAETSGRVLASVPRPDDFLEMAMRGLFVYDWTDVYRKSSETLRCYEQVAVPLVAVRASALPRGLAGLVEELVLDSVFARAASIDISKCLATESLPGEDIDT